MLRLSIEYVATIFDSKKVINKNSVIANVTSPICIPRSTPRKRLYQEGQYESLSPRTQLKTLHVWMKVFPPVGILLERMMAMSFLQVRRKQNVSARSESLYHNCLRITCPTFFQWSSCPIARMVLLWIRLSFVLQKYVENFPANLQSRKEWYSSVFKELHKHRLKKIFSKSSRPEVFCQKDVLRNFAKFTGKHLCQSPF